MTELLPCPFCGGEPDILCGGPGNWFVQCKGCKVTTNDVMHEHAVELWNARHPAVVAQGGTAEPVAWREETFGAGKGWYYAEKPWSKDAQPLYAAPPTPHAALREVLREAKSTIEAYCLAAAPQTMERINAALAALQPEAPAPAAEEDHEQGCQSGDFGPCDCKLSSKLSGQMREG